MKKEIKLNQSTNIITKFNPIRVLLFKNDVMYCPSCKKFEHARFVDNRTLVSNCGTSYKIAQTYDEAYNPEFYQIIPSYETTGIVAQNLDLKKNAKGETLLTYNVSLRTIGMSGSFSYLDIDADDIDIDAEAKKCGLAVYIKDAHKKYSINLNTKRAYYINKNRGCKNYSIKQTNNRCVSFHDNNNENIESIPFEFSSVILQYIVDMYGIKDCPIYSLPDVNVWVSNGKVQGISMTAQPIEDVKIPVSIILDFLRAPGTTAIRTSIHLLNIRTLFENKVLEEVGNIFYNKRQYINCYADGKLTVPNNPHDMDTNCAAKCFNTKMPKGLRRAFILDPLAGIYYYQYAELSTYLLKTFDSSFVPGMLRALALRSANGLDNTEYIPIIEFIIGMGIKPTILAKKIVADTCIVRDTFSMLSTIINVGYPVTKELFNGTIKDIHDRLAPIVSKIKNRPTTIPLYSNELSLEGTYNGFEFSLPRNTGVLCDIGESMRICVGGYGDWAVSKSCTIVSVTQNDRYMGCIELNTNSIVQAKAFSNDLPSGELLEAIRVWALINHLAVQTSDVDFTTKEHQIEEQEWFVGEPVLSEGCGEFDLYNERYRNLQRDAGQNAVDIVMPFYEDDDLGF